MHTGSSHVDTVTSKDSIGDVVLSGRHIAVHAVEVTEVTPTTVPHVPSKYRHVFGVSNAMYQQRISCISDAVSTNVYQRCIECISQITEWPSKTYDTAQYLSVLLEYRVARP